MQELYKGRFLDIHKDPGTEILVARWKGYQSFDSGSAGCERILEFVEMHGIGKVLNDNVEVRGLWMDLARWCAQVWFPRMKRAGMTQFAWVYSEAKFSQMSMDAALLSMDPGAFGVQVFHNRDEALRWLTSGS